MNEQLKTLLTLQDLEIRIGGIKEATESLMRQTERMEAEVAALEKDTIDTKAALEEMRKGYRSMESEVQVAQARLQKSEGTLRSVKTNREYQSLLKEIEDQKSKIWALEDSMLEYLEKVEEGEKELRVKIQELQRFKIRAEEKKMEMDLEKKENEKRLKILLIEREKTSERIRPDLAGKYSLIKTSVGSRVAVLVKNAVCSGCNMNIPPQMYNELQQKDDIVYCPHCQRMIYWTKEESELELLQG